RGGVIAGQRAEDRLLEPGGREQVNSADDRDQGQRSAPAQNAQEPEDSRGGHPATSVAAAAGAAILEVVGASAPFSVHRELSFETRTPRAYKTYRFQRPRNIGGVGVFAHRNR